MQELGEILLLTFVTVFIILACWGVYTLWYKPKRLHQWYVDTLEGMGYKVNVYPYTLLGGGVFKQINDDCKEHGDPMHSFKEFGGKYDVSVLNLFNRVYLELYSPELIKLFCQP